jgi:hypothetical protein
MIAENLRAAFNPLIVPQMSLREALMASLNEDTENQSEYFEEVLPRHRYGPCLQIDSLGRFRESQAAFSLMSAIKESTCKMSLYGVQ